MQYADVAQNYRYWVIWRCPTVRFLDFTKVRDVERKKAKELFGTAEEPTELASQVCTSNCLHVRSDADALRSRAPSPRASSCPHTQTALIRVKSASTPTRRRSACGLPFSTQAVWRRWPDWRRTLLKDAYQHISSRAENLWRLSPRPYCLEVLMGMEICA